MKSRSICYSNVYCWCPVTAAVNSFCFRGCKSVISKTATLTGTQNRGTPSEPCLLVSSFMRGGEEWGRGGVGVGEWGGRGGEREQYLRKGEEICEVGTSSIALGNILEQKMIERSWADLIVLDTL